MEIILPCHAYGFTIIYTVTDSPVNILSLIVLLMFSLPPEFAENVSLGITVFLALSVLMLSLLDDLPQSSDSFPIIGQCMHLITTAHDETTILNVSRSFWFLKQNVITFTNTYNIQLFAVVLISEFLTDHKCFV